jgi:hypothetical protein
MSAEMDENGDAAAAAVVADPLRGLRLRMIREVEFFLERSIGRAEWRRVIPTCPSLGPSARSAANGRSWYDSRGRRPSSSSSSSSSSSAGEFGSC